MDLLKEVGRSVKKNPPTIASFDQKYPKVRLSSTINSVIDIYNVECLRSFPSHWRYDLDKIRDQSSLRLVKREIPFAHFINRSILSETDPVYRDQRGHHGLARCEDGERYKMEETIIQETERPL